MSNYEEDIVSFIPANQRGFSDLTGYMKAFGALIDRRISEIENLRLLSDPDNVPAKYIDHLAAQFDITYARNINDERKREMIRSAIDIYRSNGTERALRRIFRLIGWEVDIDYCYAIHPCYDGHVQTLDPNQPDYAPSGAHGIIFGKEVAVGTRTFVNLYHSAENIYKGYPIYGEDYNAFRYENYKASAKLPMVDEKPLYVKLPYIRLSVTSEDYRIFVEDIIDPVTGKVFGYSQTEKYAIVQEAIDSFLQAARPANVAIVDIITPRVFETERITAKLTEELTFVTVGAGANYDGTIAYGVPTERYRLGELIDVWSYGAKESPRITSAAYTITRTYKKGTIGAQGHLPTRLGSTLKITIPSDARVTVVGSQSDRITLAKGQGSWFTIRTLEGGTDINVELPHMVSVRINISTPSTTGDITLELT